jgi:hypothetical protein
MLSFWIDKNLKEKYIEEKFSVIKIKLIWKRYRIKVFSITKMALNDIWGQNSCYEKSVSMLSFIQSFDKIGF